MTFAIYPAAVATWTDRLNQIDTIWAQDPNSLAAEILALESTLGVMPQQEKFPVIGSAPITYATVDARLTAIAQAAQLPVVSLTNSEQWVPNNQSSATNYGQWNSYRQAYDPFGMYNGTDITIPATGWWLVTAGQKWDWWSNGYHGMWLYIDNDYAEHHHWFWDFPENGSHGYWRTEDNLEREAKTHISWQGILNQGQRLRILSENGSSDTPHRSYSQTFSVSMLRSYPPAAAPAGG